MRLKIFKINLDNIRYDTYKGAIVAAEDIDKVEKLCKNVITNSICCDFSDFVMEHFPGSHPRESDFFIYYDQNYTISEIGEGEFEQPTIIMTSFNAG